MNALFRKVPLPERILLVDIGGTSIGASLIEIEANDIPSILYQVRIRIPITEKKGIQELGAAALRTLEEVAERTHVEGFRTSKWDSIDGVHVLLGSPWCFPSIATVNKSFEKPEEITKRVIRSIIAAQREKQEQAHPDTHVIEAETLNVSLNGYSIRVPFGKKAEKLSVDVFSSRVMGHTTENIERKIGEFFATENIHFHSSTLALYTTVRGVFTDGVSHLVMDITGDMTEVLLVKEETLVEIGSIPIGTNDIPRSVAEAYKTTAEEALSRVKIMQEGKNAKENIKMSAAAEKVRTQWKEELTKLLDEFEHSTGIPQKVFYTAPPDMRPLFEELLIDRNLFTQDDVVFLDLESLSSFVDYRTRGYKDFFLTLTALYTHMYKSGLEE